MDEDLIRRISAMESAMSSDGDAPSDSDPISVAKCIVAQMKADGLIFKEKTESLTELSNQLNDTLADEESKMMSLMSGDLIWLRTDDPNYKGMMLGNESLHTVGVEPEDGTISPRFAEGLFRVCVGLNYRSKTEIGMIRKAIFQAEDKAAMAEELNPELATKRNKLEARQNDEQIEKLTRGENTEPIKYGDVIQLQHVRSGLFVATHKTPAPMNPSCRKVSLKAGSFAAQFRILPRFKVRSKGSLVYVDDQIQFQGVKFEYLKLGVSPPPTKASDRVYSMKERPNSGDGDREDDNGRKITKLRQSSLLKREANCEVNGSMDPYQCFTIKLYYRQNRRAVLLNGHFFRLYHPEANAYVQASSNPDKGEILDATGSDDDPLHIHRSGGVPAHIAYMKPFVSSFLASNPIHSCAKAVWSFESVDATHCHEIKFDTPLRLRHVPSGKYLSVITSKPAQLTEHRNDVCYDAALVFLDELSYFDDGSLGSPTSLLFYLVPTDVTSDTLKTLVSTVRLEHRTADGRVLHFIATKEAKPKLVHRNKGYRKTGENLMISKEIGCRLLFSTAPSPLDVLKIEPLTPSDSSQISKLMSRIQIFKKYAYLWHTSDMEFADLITISEIVVTQCLDLIDDVRKGSVSPRRFGGNISECMTEAETTPPLEFAAIYGGDCNARLQKVSFEVKLLDAMFEATLAPYNHAALTGRINPFDGIPHEGTLKAVQKFLFVAIQNLVRDNLRSQEYFSKASSRIWKRELTQPYHDEDGISIDLTLEPLIRKFELWHNIIIDQVEDPLGATVTLGQLLRSSEKIVKTLVSTGIMDRFKNLVAKCGPDVRFINIFTAICFVEGKPSRSNQEMCLRKLWMNAPDRYSFMCTVHEGIAMVNPKVKRRPPRARVSDELLAKAPKAFLGKTANNTYGSLCIAWSSLPDWKPNCGALWYSPEEMKIPIVKEGKIDGVEAPIKYVPIEHLMWVLEPYQLCKSVTGVYWKPFTFNPSAGTDDNASFLNKNKAKKRSSLLSAASREFRVKIQSERFNKQVKLANYVIAQFDLLTNMCKGRSYNCIRMLEKSFSFDMLMNLATNPLLPSKFTAAIIGFIDALYVDRFPQTPYGGAPCLPEKLWVFEDKTSTQGLPRASTTPILRTQLNLTSEEAFPAFFVPYHSSVYGGDNPVLSHPDHFKFFLLRTFCNESLRKFDSTGRLIHGQRDINQFKMAVVRAQSSLLSFGFQSTLPKLRDIFEINAVLLDGRSDLKNVEASFDPPHERHKHGGADYDTVTKLKSAIIKSFNELVDLRSNFRLGQILHIFKSKVGVWKRMQEKTGMQEIIKSKEAQYILQSTPEAIKEMYEDFEDMFPGGKGEAIELDLAKLCNMPDIDLGLLDAVMYDDDDLMAAALKLLESNYGQRRHLRQALNEVFLLDDTKLLVYGDIHVLRAQITEIMYLVRTSSSWGVKSKISGAFGDKEYGTIMSILDRLHAFIFVDVYSTDEEKTWKDDESNYSGYFKETGLDNETYECIDLWSLDVASKWASKLSLTNKNNNTEQQIANANHQDLLRSCNFQSVLAESIHMDSDIALKGSICTRREKLESQHRLTLVKRAFLSLSVAFTSKNPKNQELIFPHMDSLETLATPGNIARGNPIPSIEMNEAIDEVKDTTEVWPHTVADLAQALIMSTLKDNGSLCEQVPSSLLHLFASIADQSVDPSTSPALELIFILAKPEGAPSIEFQLKACDRLFSHSHHRKRVHEALKLCLTSSGANINAVVSRAVDESEIVEIEKAVKNMPLTNPSRLISLTMALVEGGNERVASQLKHISGMDIDNICTCLVNELMEAGLVAFEGTTSNVDQHEEIFRRLSTPNTLCTSLLNILIELVYLLPLNNDQMTSTPLWMFLEQAMVPIVHTLALKDSMEDEEAAHCGELIGMIEMLFFAISRLGLFKVAMESPLKKRIITSIAEDVEIILSDRYRPPEHLESAFRHTIDEYGVQALSLSQFIILVEKLMLQSNPDMSVTKAAQKARQEDISNAFIDADLDGNGVVNLYEFVKLYENVSSKTKGRVSVSSGDLLHKQGHQLSLRTVECCLRIIHLKNGYGTALGVMRFTRGDKYGSRLRKIDASSVNSLDGAGSGKNNAKEPRPLISSRMRREFMQGEVSLQAKFEAFQAGIEHNPKILEALLRRRFSMVSVLEKGSPKPINDGSDEKKKDDGDNIPSLASLNSLYASSKPQRKKKIGAKSAGSRMSLFQVRSMRVAHHDNNSNTTASMIDEVSAIDDKERLAEIKASKIIQRAFRCMIARQEMNQRLQSFKIYGLGEKKTNLKITNIGVHLTWQGLTSRFVTYVSDHYWETAETETGICILILEVWYSHLVKARTHFYDKDGNKLPESQLSLAKDLVHVQPRELTQAELTLYHEKQSILNDLGVTILLSQIISNLSNNIQTGGLPDRAIQLFIELLNGGNNEVQERLFTHLVEGDDEGKLLFFLEGRLLKGFDTMSEAKKRGIIGSNNEAMMEDILGDYEILMQTARFMQLLCEGHHLGFQEYMRTQPMHTASHANLVKSVANIIVLLCDSSYLISRFGQMEISLISQLLQFLIESVQGPCSGNQHLIGKSDILASLNSIICAKIWKDEELVQKDPLYIDIKTFSCVLLASLLEGGEDESIHEQLSRKIEIVSLQDYQESLEEHIYEILGKVKLESRPRTPYEINFIETKQTALVAVWTILIELHITPVSKLRVKGRKQLIGLVEVAWRNNIHRACFAIPFESQFFTDTAKRAFMETADLSTSDKRMYELIEQTDLFISEMDIIHEQAEKSWIYRLLYNNLRYFKLANYGLVFALNLNILLSPATLGAPSAVIAREIRGDGHMDAFEKSSVIVTTALGALVTVGYGVIISILAVTEVPLLIQELDELALNKVNLTTLDIMMFWTSPLFGLFASFLFIFLHYLNSAPAPELYVAIILMLNVPLALRAYRQTIGTSPSTKALRKFAILYDLLVKKSFLRNHVILAVFCFLGYFVNVEFFTLELLDVVAISPVIADIIQSVTSPGVALGLVFYLFVITVIIYAAFGMNHFASSLIVPVELEDGTPDRVQCGSMLQCFYVIFHLGLSEAGNMNAFLTTNYAGDEEYPMRIIYDSVFFVWVGIVLVNIITGLMVDTFSSIREEKQARADILSSACFVCGTLRRSYDDMSLAPEAPSFDLHISLEHDPWTYVFYIAYLKKKSPQDDSGIESYVRSEVEQNALNWIPSRTSFFIEASKTGAVKSSYVK